MEDRQVELEKVRCSSIDRVLSCAGSLLEVAHPYNPTSFQATEGTAGHAVLERVVLDLADDLEAECERMAERMDCDLDGLRFLAREGARAWASIIADDYDSVGIATETPLEGPYTTGRADVVCSSMTRAIIIDWKLGHSADRHPGQLGGYASGMRAQTGLPTSGIIETYEVHVRHGIWHRVDWDGDALDDLEERLARALRKPTAQWAPGHATCKYCPARISCDARRRYLRDAARLIGDVAGLGLTRAAVATVYDKAEALRAALREYDEAVSTALDDGPLCLPDGREVRWRETKREEVVVSKAWSTLRGLGLSAAEITGRLRVSKTALKSLVSERAPRGQKGAAFDNALRLLRDSQAIVTTIAQRRETVARKGNQG